jgi:hypothetical protein
MTRKNFFLTFLVALLICGSTSVRAQLEESLRVPWPGFAVLKGRWQCPGQGIFHIKNVTSTGSMEVEYFNPESVHVIQAQAARDGTSTKILIILRQSGTFCCTYNLAYEPEHDQIRGVFWQKNSPQPTEVIFQRQKSLSAAN